MKTNLDKYFDKKLKEDPSLKGKLKKEHDYIVKTMKTKPMQNNQNLGKSTDEVSLCLSCYCATKTIKGKCGKCKARKITVSEWEKHFQGTQIDVPSNTGTDWEKDFNQQFVEIYPDGDESFEYIEADAPVMKNFIRTLLSNQAKRHEEEILKRVEHQAEYNEILIKQLKQQHKAQLESMRMEQTDNKYWMKRLGVESSDYSYGHTHGWNFAVDKLNKKLDQMLQDSGKEGV